MSDLFTAVPDISHTVFGSSATFIDADDSETSISVVKVAPEKIVNFGLNDVTLSTLTVNVKTNEVPLIEEGDRIRIDSITYTVVGSPEKDSQGLLWILQLDE